MNYNYNAQSKQEQYYGNNNNMKCNNTQWLQQTKQYNEYEQWTMNNEQWTMMMNNNKNDNDQ